MAGRGRRGAARHPPHPPGGLRPLPARGLPPALPDDAPRLLVPHRRRRPGPARLRPDGGGEPRRPPLVERAGDRADGAAPLPGVPRPRPAVPRLWRLGARVRPGERAPPLDLRSPGTSAGRPGPRSLLLLRPAGAPRPRRGRQRPGALEQRRAPLRPLRRGGRGGRPTPPLALGDRDRRRWHRRRPLAPALRQAPRRGPAAVELHRRLSDLPEPDLPQFRRDPGADPGPAPLAPGLDGRSLGLRPPAATPAWDAPGPARARHLARQTSRSSPPSRSPAR